MSKVFLSPAAIISKALKCTIKFINPIYLEQYDYKVYIIVKETRGLFFKKQHKIGKYYYYKDGEEMVINDEAMAQKINDYINKNIKGMKN